MIYIENNSLDPFFNFALEEYLIYELNISDSYFIFWRTEPTLMIGRHQNTIEEVNQDYIRKKKIHVVRRISGGGTIYTDPNGWQFSFIVKNKPSREINFHIYTIPIIQALSKLGVEAKLSGRNDILVEGKKISGNAQYTNHKCVLHHGSILFNTDLEELVKAITASDDKIISKGIKSIRERVTNVIDYIDKKIDALEFKERMLQNLLKNTEGTYQLTSKDIERVNEITEKKFRTWDWNYGQSPKFNIVKSKRLEGGKIEFHLDVKKGYIHQCKIHGDFFSKGDVEFISSSLIGCPYREKEIQGKLKEIHAADFFYKITIDQLMGCIF